MVILQHEPLGIVTAQTRVQFHKACCIVSNSARSPLSSATGPPGYGRMGSRWSPVDTNGRCCRRNHGICFRLWLRPFFLFRCFERCSCVYRACRGWRVCAVCRRYGGAPFIVGLGSSSMRLGIGLRRGLRAIAGNRAICGCACLWYQLDVTSAAFFASAV